MNLDLYQQETKRTAARKLEAYPECIRKGWEALHALRGAMAEENPEGAKKLAASADQLLKTFDVLIHCLGLAGEVGETLDLLKKHLGHGHPLDLDKLKKEFGDVRWYGAVLEDAFGFKSSEVAQANVDKLRARYPTGFTVEASKAKADEFVPIPDFGAER